MLMGCHTVYIHIYLFSPEPSHTLEAELGVALLGCLAGLPGRLVSPAAGCWPPASLHIGPAHTQRIPPGLPDKSGVKLSK